MKMTRQMLSLMTHSKIQTVVQKIAGSKPLVALDPNRNSVEAMQFEAGLRALVVGQEQAVCSLTSLYQIFQAGFTNSTRPIGSLLFLGPTGSGKTHVVEAASEVLFGNRNAVITIDCAEFQHSHEIAKLIGSPPGYLGHRETPPVLSQENLDKCKTNQHPLTLVLFDEIEKASDALWQLLLGVLDKGRLTLGDNRVVDLSQTMIFMTSNLGAKEMNQLINGSIGFAPTARDQLLTDDLDQSIYRKVTEAARRKFSPEFLNRIDNVVVFYNLRQQQLRRIIDLELMAVQCRIDEGADERFILMATDAAKDFLLAEGTDLRGGARHLKRAIEQFVVNPLASLALSKQLRLGNVVVLDVDPSEKRLIFFRDENETSLATAAVKSVSSLPVNQRDQLAT
jgi:ATP-dependent Clp protease ATP-binding subunit ClpB